VDRDRGAPQGRPQARVATSEAGGVGERRLPRSQRIRKRPEFVRIQGGPLRVSTRHLLLLFAPRVDDDDAASAPRLGVVASRKVGNAVARNRAKRLVREAFRHHQGLLPRGLDLVIVVRPGTERLGLAEVAGELVDAAPQIARRLRRGGAR
jgi:ribonuclease P protein component